MSSFSSRFPGYPVVRMLILIMLPILMFALLLGLPLLSASELFAEPAAPKAGSSSVEAEMLDEQQQQQRRQRPPRAPFSEPGPRLAKPGFRRR